MSGWKQNAVLICTALFGFVVFSPETFAHLPWLIALSKFAMAGGLAAMGIAAHSQASAARSQGLTNAAAIQAVDDKVTTTGKAIDGRMDQLVLASKAQGAQEQRQETRQDAKDALL